MKTGGLAGPHRPRCRKATPLESRPRRRASVPVGSVVAPLCSLDLPRQCASNLVVQDVIVLMLDHVKSLKHDSSDVMKYDDLRCVVIRVYQLFDDNIMHAMLCLHEETPDK